MVGCDDRPLSPLHRSGRRLRRTWLVVAWAVVGCDDLAAGRPFGPLQSGLESLPIRDVRVLLASGAERLRVKAAGGLRARGADGPRAETLLPPTCDLEPVRPDALRLGRNLLLTGAAILEAVEKEPLRVAIRRRGEWSAWRTYNGRLRVQADEAGLNVVNLVDVEHYVACVVAKEAWPTFHREALKAQAVAARTYALFQMRQRVAAPFDLGSSEGWQVYHGVTDGSLTERAMEAARATRGVVCTWGEGNLGQLIPAYYAAACGGMSQSAAIYGTASDLPPLRGQVRCDFCRIAPRGTYRWGPVRVEKTEAFGRLAARHANLASLERIEDIEVVEETRDGRWLRVRIEGVGGQGAELPAEAFRLAIGSNVVRSTACRIRVEGEEIVFDRGKGFGHGLGLCQWGSHGMALEGKDAAAILRQYYPGVSLTRVY